jgi:methionine-rich copper-binding protein CopC
MNKLRTLSSLAAAAAITLVASQAQAHAHLVKASPAADATVGAPTALQLQFSEKLEPKFSGVDLMTLKGEAVAVSSTVDGKDGKSLAATPKAPLKPGAYMVMWHVVSADGHKMKGDYNFTVK